MLRFPALDVMATVSAAARASSTTLRVVPLLRGAEEETPGAASRLLPNAER